MDLVESELKSMSSRTRILILAVTAVATVLTVPARADADPDAVIEYRQHVMKALDAHAAAIGQMLSGTIPDDDFVTHLEAVALTASTAVKAFQPNVPGGDSKPEVWTNRNDFTKRMNEFASKAAEAAKLGREKGKDAAATAVIDALSCKSCHDRYRKEKRKEK